MTPHNQAKKGEVAKIVLMPGDPLRAQYIAENYLQDAKCFNTVRNMLGYTGYYKGNKVSVMASGMGNPSMGIYSYELYQEYDVETIIRIGSAGALQENIQLKDLVIAMSVSTDSSFADQLNLPGTYAPSADFSLLRRAVEIGEKKGIEVRPGNILCSDHFYNFDNTVNLKWKEMGVLAVEMESAALYITAAFCKKKALALLSISDQLCTGEALTAEERRIEFGKMIELALEMTGESTE